MPTLVPVPRLTGSVPLASQRASGNINKALLPLLDVSVEFIVIIIRSSCGRGSITAKKFSSYPSIALLLHPLRRSHRIFFSRPQDIDRVSAEDPGSSRTMMSGHESRSTRSQGGLDRTHFLSSDFISLDEATILS